MYTHTHTHTQSQEVHLVSSAGETDDKGHINSSPRSNLNAPPQPRKVRYDNVRAWHEAWGGREKELPLWTKMARERVVMQVAMCITAHCAVMCDMQCVQ